jgi:hypothetical protein
LNDEDLVAIFFEIPFGEESRGTENEVIRQEHKSVEKADLNSERGS